MADSSRDINESDKSNNALTVPGITVSAQPSESLEVNLLPGWNAIPFIYGAPVSTDCSGEALLRISEGNYSQLDPQTLHFTSEADASEFTAAHGTAASPRTAMALGGAWYYADAPCSMAYSLAPTLLPSRSTAAALEVPAGGAMLSILPWMADNSIQNILGTCEPKRVSVWDAAAQEWGEFNGTVEQGMAGGVMVVRSTAPCHLG
jgi:hypothetical protein